MTSFLVALVALVIGYAVYGKIVDLVFGPTDRPTPEVRLNDGVDYMPLSSCFYSSRPRSFVLHRTVDTNTDFQRMIDYIKVRVI